VVETSTVLLNGRELTRLTESEYRRVRGCDIGLVFQDPGTSLNPLRSVNSQLIEAVRAHHSVSKPMASDITAGLLHEVGFPEHRSRTYPHQLSGGMRQRVMIALALAGEPDLLIADEPTSALDVTVQAQILELLDHLREKRGMALLLITHDLSLVGGRTNRVVVMHAGRVVESGATEDIFAAPSHSYTRALFAAIPTLDGRSSLQWQGRVDRD
jgi:ABC-type dipeptide/oligopeptide/nickel transport system ATPase component